ncbi:aspartyl-phosphate phosphatase Spo0E family protein [Effusibacillus lacus]|uniref:aspartyl-phosphate phosphatase Spo0E family protein n=1 Tax=Effusibacillus lacus TaxID=1348429 RepID=UPI000BB94D96|nr:aspartyl-phosphate phosphatase Spo0E family protein [Effusibacillus lacus]TCS69545.1 Spo0E like sporulation regulatory protein [Effusibacillus lacus]
MKNDTILSEIDQLRMELHRLISQKGDLLDPGVLEKSQQLDRLIVQSYKIADNS